MRSDIQVCYWHEVPELFEQIVAMYFAQWASEENGMQKDKVRADFQQNYMSAESLQTGLVAILEGKPIGIIRLKDPSKSGLKDAPKDAPWIGGLQVEDGFRGKRVGTLLMKGLLEHARDHDQDALHIWTDKTDMYETMTGSAFVEMVEKQEGGPAKLYRIDVHQALAALSSDRSTA